MNALPPLVAAVFGSLLEPPHALAKNTKPTTRPCWNVFISSPRATRYPGFSAKATRSAHECVKHDAEIDAIRRHVERTHVLGRRGRNEPVPREVRREVHHAAAEELRVAGQRAERHVRIACHVEARLDQTALESEKYVRCDVHA